MAPKKLTDCPENLREAIDWFIQVRYGNGDNQGLDKLAKALKRLVEDAIEKALVTNVDALCQIIDPFKSYNCCKEKVTEIEKLKENKKSTNGSLNAFLKHVKDLNDCYKSHFDDSQQKAYDDIMSKLGHLGKLQESLARFTNETQCKDLLTNLCTGLETFLGFNSETKGYDGKGIVYSDLDRVCDAVMAFLSGILGMVQKNKNLVKYYYTLSESNKKLKTMQGKSGFRSVHGTVSRDIRDYVDWFTGHSEGFKKELEKLHSENIAKFNHLLSELNTANVGEYNAVAVKLYECIMAATAFLVQIRNVDKKFKELDNGLKNKLNDDYNTLKNKVTEFAAAADNSELHELLKLTETKFDDLKNSVIKAAAEANDNVTKLKESCEAQIEAAIQVVEQKVNDTHGALNAWIGAAEMVLSAAIQVAEKIHTDLNPMEKGKDGLGKKIEDISTSNSVISRANGELDTHVQSLGAWVARAEGMRKEAEKQAKKALKILRDEDDENLKEKITNAAKSLKAKTESLKQSYDRAKEAVKVAKDAASATLQHLDNLVKKDLQLLKGKFREPIAKYFEDIARALTQANTLAGNSSALFPQEFWSNLSMDDAPLLRKWGEQKAGALRGVLDGLDRQGHFPLFKLFLNKLHDEKYPSTDSGKNFFGCLSSDVNTKVEGVFGLHETQYVINHMKNYKGTESVLDGTKNGTQKLEEDIGKIHDAIKELKPDNKNRQKDGSEYGSVDEEMAGLHEAITESLTAFTDALGKLLENKSTVTKDGVLDKLGELGAAIDNVGENKPGSLYKIREDIKRLQTGNFKTQPPLIASTIEAITNELKRLQGVLKSLSGRKDQDVIRRLEDLKGQGFSDEESWDGKDAKGLKKILKNVDELKSKNLKELRGSVNRVLTEAQKHAVISIEQNRKQFEVNITAAEKAVRTEAKIKYKDNIHRLCENLKDEFNAHSAKINDIIIHDESSGIKGLMKAMKANQGWLNSVKYTNNFAEVSEKFKNYLDSILLYVESQTKRDGKDPTEESKKITKIKDAADVLLDHLNCEIDSTRSFNFDHASCTLISHLSTSLASLQPSAFPNPRHPELLDPVKQGLDGFVKEIEKAYVNRYDGGSEAFLWEDERYKKVTDDGMRCAKVCLTIASTLYEELYHLFFQCSNGWKVLELNGSRVYKNGNDDLKHYLMIQGYETVNLINKDHSGQQVAKIMKAAFDGQVDFQASPDADYIGHRTLAKYLHCIKDSRGTVSALYWNVADYFKVCHIVIPQTKTYPCSVRDMLSWLSGLPYTRVYSKIEEHCTKLLNEEDKAKGAFPNKDDPVISRILQTELIHSLHSAFQNSYNLLVTIQGHGCGFKQADYPYACNFCDNSSNFYYPQNAPELLDMLKEICHRLLRSLYFLYSQCRYTAAEGNGWADCQYGRNVSGHQWLGDRPSDESNCQRKSPLQAYLTDGLRGFLPHKVTSIGCKSECSTCPTSPGQLCITPMGFWDLPGAGSITNEGSYICNMLNILCDNASSVFPGLLNCLLHLSPMPPKCLADQFSFFTNIFRVWSCGMYSANSAFVSHMTSKAIPITSMYLYSTKALKLTEHFKSLSGPKSDHADNVSNAASHSDLYSLCTQSTLHPVITCSAPNVQCAPYLKPLCFDAYHTYPQKHTGVYLSWLTYLTFDFYNLLKSLFESFCNIDCKAFGCSTCKCQVGKHGVDNNCTCKSLVQCSGVLIMIHRYGFTFGNARTLVATNTKKTCRDFHSQLSSIMNSKHFKTLLEECDDFLFKIRLPFMSLTLALWLLSLLYLIHVMVIRLDLLHIKSHLHSPSSHRIAAQSLLAAARVGKLAKLTYLQP